jgi:guanylate kinase
VYGILILYRKVTICIDRLVFNIKFYQKLYLFSFVVKIIEKLSHKFMLTKTFKIYFFCYNRLNIYFLYFNFMNSVKRRGLMLALSSPSGAGKTSICKNIVASDSDLAISVSCTTRDKRPGEIEGKDYFFVSEQKFNEMNKNNEMLEHAKVFGNYYGTPRSHVMELLNKGQDILFDIDWQGVQQLAQLMQSDLVSIFILPPGIKELESRLLLRAQDSKSIINNRMSEAFNELSHWPEYDYVVINRNLEQATEDVKSILRAERLKKSRRLGLVNFVNDLRKEKSNYDIKI